MPMAVAADQVGMPQGRKTSHTVKPSLFQRIRPHLCSLSAQRLELLEVRDSTQEAQEVLVVLVVQGAPQVGTQGQMGMITVKR